ncbi:hypothetical protein ACFZAT_20480 [Streptomyces sp. NPDC008163]|uniref:hypothetical protein n=1 Tax=Streptomyces sp. NPDC008163 TaxID=3364818 RepID=UPI0036ED9280
MSDSSLSLAWLASWTSRVSRVLAVMTGEFERRHGYPPGSNEVRPASRDDQTAARALAQAGLISADLVTFYDSIGPPVPLPVQSVGGRDDPNDLALGHAAL